MPTKLCDIADVQKCAVLAVFRQELITINSNIKGKNIKKYIAGKGVKTVIYFRHRGMKY